MPKTEDDHRQPLHSGNSSLKFNSPSGNKESKDSMDVHDTMSGGAEPTTDDRNSQLNNFLEPRMVSICSPEIEGENQEKSKVSSYVLGQGGFLNKDENLLNINHSDRKRHHVMQSFGPESENPRTATHEGR